VQLGQGYIPAGEVGAALLAGLVQIEGVPHARSAMVEVNGRWESGLVDVLGYVRAVLPLASTSHTMLGS
jgi:hypothetical protein